MTLKHFKETYQNIFFGFFVLLVVLAQATNQSCLFKATEEAFISLLNMLRVFSKAYILLEGGVGLKIPVSRSFAHGKFSVDIDGDVKAAATWEGVERIDTVFLVTLFLLPMLVLTSCHWSLHMYEQNTSISQSSKCNFLFKLQRWCTWFEHPLL